tara:strand:- start:738 stop:1079 length:342 start_codon:yes stop_codon:yes gene_type:complete
MVNLIQSLKSEIYNNGVVNWKAVLFLLSEPIALVATYFMVSRGNHAIENPKTFTISTFYTVLFTLFAFCLRVLYQIGKPTAFLFVILNCIVWGYCAYVWTKAYIAYNKFNKKH